MPSCTPPDLATVRVSEIEVGGERCVVLSWPIEPVARAAPKRATLTAAERAVEALLLAGLSDAEIAELRGTTRSTVTKQVDAVFRKLGVKSRRELIARSTPPQSGSSQRA